MGRLGVGRPLLAAGSLLVLATVVVTAAAAPPANYTLIQRLKASGGIAFDRFGSTLAISDDGNTALVGTSPVGSTTPGTGSRGQVYVFTRAAGKWTQQQQLTNPGGFAGDGFGTAVALSGNGTTALLGAPGMDSGRGAAVVYHRTGTTWTQQGDPLSVNQGHANDRFGSAVALSVLGTTLAIGAPGMAGGGAVLTSTNGTNAATLQATGGVAADRLGASVAVSGDGKVVLAGAAGNASSRGAAFIFTNTGTNTWTQQKLTATGGAANDEFGAAVSFPWHTSTVALVGAPGVAGAKGAAYLFTKGATWTQQQQLTATGGAANARFGATVSIGGAGTTALVGAPTAGGNGNGATYFFAAQTSHSGTTWTQQQLGASGGANDRVGTAGVLSGDGTTVLVSAVGVSSARGSASAFLHSGTSWTAQDTLTPSGGDVHDNFGEGVAISADANTILTGAPNTAGGRGAAYIFARSGGTWSQQAQFQGLFAQGFLGASCALSPDGNTAFVSTGFGVANGAAVSGGEVLVLARSGTDWNVQQQLAFVGGTSTEVLSSIALSGDGSTLLVTSSTPTLTGAAYIYTRTGTTWTQTARLTGAGGGAGDFFGSSAAISTNGTTVLVGARGNYFSPAPPSSLKGTAYLFTKNTKGSWTQQQLTANGGVADDRFGTSVALSGTGDVAVVGAVGVSGSRGAAYIFTRTKAGAWTQQKFTSSGAAANDSFGWTVRLTPDGMTAFVDAAYEGSSRGGLYVYSRATGAWTLQQHIVGPDYTNLGGVIAFGGDLATTPDGKTLLVGHSNSALPALYVYAR